MSPTLAAVPSPFSPSSWLDGAVAWVLEKTAQAVNTVLEFVVNAPGPLVDGQLFGGALDGPLGYAVGLGLWVLPIFVLLGLVTWTVRGEPGRILQLLLVETPIAAAAMFLVPAVVTELTRVADAAFAWMVSAADVRAGLETIVQTQLVAGGPAGGILVLLGAVLMLLGAVVTYMVMLVRSVVIGASVLLGPMLLATRTWEPARGIAGQWIALTAMVVAIKAVIGFVWAAGWALLRVPAAPGLSGSAQSASQVMAGAAVLALGGLVPTALFRLVPQVGDRVAVSLHTGVGRLAGTGMAVAGAAATFGSRTALGAGAAGGGQAAGVLGGGLVPASSVPVGAYRSSLDPEVGGTLAPASTLAAQSGGGTLPPPASPNAAANGGQAQDVTDVPRRAVEGWTATASTASRPDPDPVGGSAGLTSAVEPSPSVGSQRPRPDPPIWTASNSSPSGGGEPAGEDRP